MKVQLGTSEHFFKPGQRAQAKKPWLESKEKGPVDKRPGLRVWERIPERPALYAIREQIVQVRNCNFGLQKNINNARNYEFITDFKSLNNP